MVCIYLEKMSVSVLASAAGTAKDEELLKLLMTALEGVTKQHGLKLERRTVKNIPESLTPVLYCYAADNTTMLLVIFDAISTLGEARLNTASPSSCYSLSPRSHARARRNVSRPA